MKRLPILFIAGMLLVSASAWAGGRAHYGGTLRLGVVGKASELDPLLSDSPTEAAVLSLTHAPLCRALEVTRVSSTVVQLRSVSKDSLSAARRVIDRLTSEASPYRSLLWPIRKVELTNQGLELTIDGASLDFESLLCHPALSLAEGPFKLTKLDANVAFPEGRPFVDAVSLAWLDERTAARQLSQNRLHGVVGASSAPQGPQLFGTYLGFGPQSPPELRAALEHSLDTTDLTRFFVPNATALSTFVPGNTELASGRAAQKPEKLTTRREVTITFDASLPEHRAVAERIQVKLEPFGYRISLSGVSRAALRAQWASGNYALIVHTVLLPPTLTGALSVLLELAEPGRRDPSLLSQLPTAEGDARERLIRGTLPRLQRALFPLFVQGVPFAMVSSVRQFSRTVYGIPRFDDLFLQSE